MSIPTCIHSCDVCDDCGNHDRLVDEAIESARREGYELAIAEVAAWMRLQEWGDGGEQTCANQMLAKFGRKAVERE